MQIDTQLTNRNDIICKVQNSFCIRWAFFKNDRDEPIDITGHKFNMSIVNDYNPLNKYEFSLLDRLAIVDNGLVLTVPGNFFKVQGQYSYELRETWPDNYNTFSIDGGAFIVNKSLTSSPVLSPSGKTPILHTVNVIQPVFYEVSQVSAYYPLAYPFNY